MHHTTGRRPRALRSAYMVSLLSLTSFRPCGHVRETPRRVQIAYREAPRQAPVVQSAEHTGARAPLPTDHDVGPRCPRQHQPRGPRRRSAPTVRIHMAYPSTCHFVPPWDSLTRDGSEVRLHDPLQTTSDPQKGTTIRAFAARQAVTTGAGRLVPAAVRCGTLLAIQRGTCARCSQDRETTLPCPGIRSSMHGAVTGTDEPYMRANNPCE